MNKSFLTARAMPYAVCMLIAIKSHSQQFTIQGKISDQKNGKVKLTHYDSLSNKKVDSAVVTNGVFNMQGKTDYPQLIALGFFAADDPHRNHPDYRGRDGINFYLENTNITIESNDDLRNAKIEAGQAQKDYEYKSAIHAEIMKDLGPLNELAQKYRQENNKEEFLKLKDKADAVFKRDREADSAFIWNHPNSVVAFQDLMSKAHLNQISYQQASLFLHHFSDKFRYSSTGKSLQEDIDKDLSIAAGTMAPDFTLTDRADKPVTLSSFRGKYVLLHFWHNMGRRPKELTQYINAAVNKTGAARLEVINVAFNANKQAWLSEIDTLSMSGHHLLDSNNHKELIMGLSGTVARAYNLTLFTIPQCLLLDPHGKIVARQIPLDSSFVQTIYQLVNTGNVVENKQLMPLLTEIENAFRAKMSSSDPALNRRNVIKDHTDQLKALAGKYAEDPDVINVLQKFDFEADAAFLKEIGTRLQQANPGNPAVSKYVSEITRLSIGQPATDVAFLNMNGAKEHLKNVLPKAKYTLVDFWATYCIPCREGIPGIKKLYAEYRAKGFDVLAISLDTKDDTWKKSVGEEDMPWAQGRTEDGGKEAMSQYRFNGIPYLALFDQKGNIVALRLQHAELEHKLKELLGEPDLSAVAQDEPQQAQRTPEQEIQIRTIITGTSLADYKKLLTNTTAETYKAAFLQNLQEKIKLKDYQKGKFGWSLDAIYKDYSIAIGSHALTGQEQLSALRAIHQKLIDVAGYILNNAQFQQYLQFRQEKSIRY